MNIKEYTEICKNIEIPDSVTKRFESTLNDIKKENLTQKKGGKPYGRVARIATAVAAIVIAFCTATLSVRAYIRHLEAIRNMSGEEVISLYENIYRYNNGMLSRELSEEEDRREGELFLAYSEDTAEPESKVIIIERKDDYKGKGVSFCKEDGILYIPDETLSDEELLECIEFGLIGQYIIGEGYELATNPDHYMNALKNLSNSDINDIYVFTAMSGASTTFYSRELAVGETARKKALKKLYMYTDKKPNKEIAVIPSKDKYTGDGVAFCTYDSTYYLPEAEMTDEDILEIIDYRMKQDYAIARINEDIETGKRTEWPHVEYVKRERIETLNNILLSEEEIISSDWLKAYAKVGEDYYDKIKQYGQNVEEQYLAVCFIYLNDDEIPEMLLTHNIIGPDDLSDRKVYLYTFNNGEAVQLKSEFGEGIGYYAQWSPFRYVERKSMLLNEGHYLYQFCFEDSEKNHDHISDTITRIEYWDMDSLKCTHTDMNIKLEHAIYNEDNKEDYNDAEITYEYYLGVKEIIYDEYTGIVEPLKGKKVDESEFNAANDALWNDEEYKTLSVSDFDKIYSDYDILESLAKCYKKQLKHN